jgi:putative proteasome-type protease
MLVYHNNSLKPGIVRRIDESDTYFNMIHNQWGEGLRRVFAQIPNPQWNDAG